MPGPHSRRSGIPRLAGTKNVDSSSQSRMPRKSSSSDPDGEFSTKTEAARAKISKPLKMQGPFRPSIVGKMVKSGDWQYRKRGKGKPKGAVEQSSAGYGTVTAARRRSSEEDQTRRTKSKSRSPPDNRPVFVDSKSDAQRKEKLKTNKIMKKIHIENGPEESCSDEELIRENQELKQRLESLTDEVCACKGALEKCHIDPVTLESIGSGQNEDSQEKAITLEEIKNTKISLENILEQNAEIMEGLKDLLKGLS